MSAIQTKRTFADMQVGEVFPPIVKLESQEAINLYSELASMPRQPETKNLHVDEEYARTTVFAGTVNAGIATVAYCVEAIEQMVPSEALINGGRIEMKAIEPIRAGDTVTITASVSGKREENGAKFVDFAVKVENQHGHTVAVANATARF